jgi:hypothetical protein
MAPKAKSCPTPIPPVPSSGTDDLPQVSLRATYPYWVGKLEGAIQLALIDLEFGHPENAVSALRNVLAELHMRDEAIRAALREDLRRASC